MTKLMADAIRRMVDEEQDRSKADERFLNRMKNVKDLGTKWSDQLDAGRAA